MASYRIICVALLVTVLGACKKPTENIKIVIDTDVIKYTAMVNVTDAATGNHVANDAKIIITGASANDIYELSGKKNIVLTNGMVTIGLHPQVIPTATQPITVTVQIQAPGYQTASRSVTFTAQQKQQVVDISLAKVGSTTPPVVLPPPPVYNDVSLNFIGRCPNRTDLEVRPSLYVYYKVAGSSDAFRYLGYMDKGNIMTKLLAQGVTYEFQIVYGEETYRPSQKIEQTAYNITVDMPAACNF